MKNHATTNNQTSNTLAIESSAFKDGCLELMKKAADNGAEIAVTENGRTLLTLAVTGPKPQKPKRQRRLRQDFLGDLAVTGPKPQKPKKPFLDADRHLLISYGDIISPIDEDWEAEFDQKWDEKLRNT